MLWLDDVNMDGTIYGVYVCKECDIELMKFYQRNE
jgi:hypothetical protein